MGLPPAKIRRKFEQISARAGLEGLLYVNPAFVCNHEGWRGLCVAAIGPPKRYAFRSVAADQDLSSRPVQPTR